MIAVFLFGGGHRSLYLPLRLKIKAMPQIACCILPPSFCPPDGDVLLLLHEGYDVAQIAKALYSDINLVALKVAELNRQGHCFRGSNYNTRFLK